MTFEDTHLAPLGVDDLAAMQIAPRELLLAPVLPAAGLMMLHARRGGSKTFLALAMGLAVAAGAPVLRWSARKARCVLYVDAELPLVDLKVRVAALRVGMGATVTNN